MVQRKPTTTPAGRGSSDDAYSKSKPAATSKSASSKAPLLIAVILLTAAGCGAYWTFVLNAEPGRTQAGQAQPKAQSEQSQPKNAQAEKAKSSESKPADRMFTKAELRQYDGSDPDKPVLLAILGKVFDVTRGKQHYGKNGGYNGFAGRDGTRAFITGQFDDEGLVEDVTGLSDYAGIKDWAEFYEKDYIYKGKLIGHYYTAQGKATKHLHDFFKEVTAQKEKKEKEEAENAKYRELFPGCNSRYGTNVRSHVWCEKESGGIKRDSAGVPRLFLQPGTQHERCACIKTTGPPTEGEDTGSNRGDLDSPYVKQYKNCAEGAHECFPDG